METTRKFPHLRWLCSFFYPPVFPDDEEKTRNARRLHIRTWIILTFVSFYLIFWGILLPDLSYRQILGLPILVLAFTVLVMLKWGYVKATSHVWLMGGWLGITLIAGLSGGTLAPLFAAYTLIILEAVIFQNWRTAVLYSVLSIASGLGMVLVSDSLPPPVFRPVGAWLTHMGLMLLIILDSAIIVRDINRLLENTRDELNKRHEAEIALNQSEQRYRILTEMMSDIAYYYEIEPDRGFVMKWVTGSVEELTGYSVDEITANHGRQLYHPDDLPVVEAGFKHASAGQSTDDEVRMITRTGKQFWINLRRMPVWNQSGDQVIGFYGIAQDISARKQATAYARENERLKDRFQQQREKNELIKRIISALSHDLRTPLAVITTSRDTLDRYYDRLSERQRKEKLQTIKQQIQFALGLLEDTVQMARGNLHEHAFYPKPTNLAVLCQISVEQIGTTRQPNQRLTFVNHALHLERLMIDEVLVSRILLNLFSNAIKYSPNGGEIRLELDQNGEWVVLRVRDEGIGIQPDKLETIFEPFYRIDDVKHIQGMGLGLSIVKDCVDRHKGRIHVESSQGQGTIFTVQLPLTIPEEKPAIAASV